MRSEARAERDNHTGFAGIAARRRDEITVGVDILDAERQVLVRHTRADAVIGIFLAD